MRLVKVYVIQKRNPSYECRCMMPVIRTVLQFICQFVICPCSSCFRFHAIRYISSSNRIFLDKIFSDPFGFVNLLPDDDLSDYIHLGMREDSRRSRQTQQFRVFWTVILHPYQMNLIIKTISCQYARTHMRNRSKLCDILTIIAVSFRNNDWLPALCLLSFILSID